MTRLNDYNLNLESLKTKYNRISGYKSYNFQKAVMISEQFLIFDDASAPIKPSNWAYGGGNEISQKSQIGGLNSVGGTFAILKHKRFFDFELDAELISSSVQGSVGIGFRVVDAQNMFLLEMHKLNTKEKKSNKIVDGYTQILVIRNNERKIIQKIDDGGYIISHLNKIKIICEFDHIRIFKENKLIFDLQNETYIAGSIAFYSAGIETAVNYKNINIQAKSCLKLNTDILPPLPMTCNLYKENYFQHIRKTYTVVQSENISSLGVWTFKRSKTGYMIEVVDSGVNSNKQGSMAILKNNRVCYEGSIIFESYGHEGTIGFIFDYDDSVNYSVVEYTKNYINLIKYQNNKRKIVKKLVLLNF